MSYFLSIGFKKNLHFSINCHSTLFKWVIELCLKFMNIIYYILYKFIVKIYY